jgi:hypothetical protein
LSVLNEYNDSNAVVRAPSNPNSKRDFVILDGPSFSLIFSCGGRWNSTLCNFDSNLKNQVHVQVLNKLQGQKAQLGVAILEARKTYNMLASTTIQVLEAYHAARVGNWWRIPRILGMDRRRVLTGKFPANRWLEYQYGWKPLISDISDIYKTLQEDLEKALLVSAKSASTREYSDNYTNADIHVEWKHEELCFSRIDAKLNPGNMLTAVKLGLVNPASIAWELTPFSFFLDWFMPVGNVLEATTATAGLTFVSGSTSKRAQASCKVSAVRYPSFPSWPLVSAGAMHAERFGFEREVLYDFPFPKFYVKPNPFSTTHTLNALALWRSLR